MAGSLTIDTLNTSSGVFSSQNAMSGIAKAWVSFTGNPTSTVTQSFNVSSITYINTGRYQINYTNALTSNNQAVVGQAGSYGYYLLCAGTSTTDCDVSVFFNGSGYADGSNYIGVAVFSN
jgi:hypothetical protein